MVALPTADRRKRPSQNITGHSINQQLHNVTNAPNDRKAFYDKLAMNMGTQYSTPQSATDNQISGRYDSKHRGSKFDINDQSLNHNNNTTATMNRQSRTNTDKEYGDFVDKFEKEFGKRMPIVDDPAINIPPTVYQPNQNNQVKEYPDHQEVAKKRRTMREILDSIPSYIGNDEQNQFVVERNQMIGKGSYGAIFVCVSPSGMKMAVKFEEAVSSTLQRKPVLYYDQQFLHFLSNSQRCQYVPLFYDYGRNTNFYYMVMDLLGPSLIDVLKKAPKNGLSSKTKLLLCIGMLHAVHEVHSKKIIHRDMKPDNFAFGSIRHPKRIYLLDFGLSKQYENNGKHICIRAGKDLTGTARYVSINTHKGYEQSRRDDIESLGYLFLYFWQETRLPWIGLHCPSKQIQFKKICELKESCNLFELDANCPKEIPEFIYYARSLPFTMDPNYNFLLECLMKIAHRYQIDTNDETYDWDLDPYFYQRLAPELNRINYYIQHNSNANENYANEPHRQQGRW